MTDLPAFSGTLDGTELLEVVAAGAGQSLAADGINYSITTALLGALIANVQNTVVVISNGQYTNPAFPFEPTTFQTLIYVDKSASEPTYITLDHASVYLGELLVKDVSGNAAVGAPINVGFTGGEQADGLTAVPITAAYGGYVFRPIQILNQWTLGTP